MRLIWSVACGARRLEPLWAEPTERRAVERSLGRVSCSALLGGERRRLACLENGAFQNVGQIARRTPLFHSYYEKRWTAAVGGISTATLKSSYEGAKSCQIRATPGFDTIELSHDLA